MLEPNKFRPMNCISMTSKCVPRIVKVPLREGFEKKKASEIV